MNTYTVVLTDQELADLSAFIDIGVKQVGVNAVKPAAALLVALDARQLAPAERDPAASEEAPAHAG